MGVVLTIIVVLAAFLFGGAIMWFVNERLLKEKTNSILNEATREAEVLKEKKLLEVKEKFLQLKSDLEKQVADNNGRIKQSENKLKQGEYDHLERADAAPSEQSLYAQGQSLRGQ